jgi:hypothetical protein
MVPSRFLGEVPRDLLTGSGGEGFVSSGRGTWHDEAAFDQDVAWDEPGLDLLSERQTVRQIAESRLLEATGKSSPGKSPDKSRKSYSGETYDSVDNLAKFFSKRGIAFDPAVDVGPRAGAGNAARPGAGGPQTPQRPQQQNLAGLGQQAGPPPHSANTTYPPRAKSPAAPRFTGRPIPRGPFRPGTKVRHAKFGVGTVMRLEGEGENQKVSILFTAHGLKKVVLKYAGLQRV